jgi:quinol-cytochrome oxidoreductase complex cytochrome b subunit
MFFNKYLKGPFMSFANAHIIDYPTPSNLNYLWSFGSMSGGVLIIQIVSGILVSMHYTPHIDLAFLSIEFLMRQIDFGWLIRYCHANGASMFFITIYLHIARGVFYSSYSYPRGQLWVSGVFIFILVMATSFMGYVLPWGQMSFWGVTVITNFFSIIPFAGTNIVEWIWGGFTIKNPTLNRIFSLHFVMPFILTAVTVLHLSLLHRDGSNNPLGCEGHYSVVGFYPYFYSKDLFAFSFFLTIFSSFVLFAPNFLGHNANYIIADPYHTPKHIVPEWYFLPFYAILRSIPDKTGGIVGMGSAIIMLLVFPLVDFAETRSPVFRPLYKFFVMFFLSNFILLGHLGRTKTDWPYLEAGQCSTFYYFFFLIVLVFSLGIFENFLSRPITHRIRKKSWILAVAAIVSVFENSYFNINEEMLFRMSERRSNKIFYKSL